jgi:predicted transcriptional regulator
MRILLILLLGIAGCAPISKNLKPSEIYTLEDGSKIKIYKTHNEIIYIKNNNFSVIGEE